MPFLPCPARPLSLAYSFSTHSANTSPFTETITFTNCTPSLHQQQSQHQSQPRRPLHHHHHAFPLDSAAAPPPPNPLHHPPPLPPPPTPRRLRRRPPAPKRHQYLQLYAQAAYRQRHAARSLPRFLRLEIRLGCSCWSWVGLVDGEIAMSLKASFEIC